MTKGFIKGHIHSDETKMKIGKANDGNFFGVCDNCGEAYHTRKSHYERRNRHFCKRECYSEFRKNKLPLEEQHSYKGVRKTGETKQIYHKRYCKNHPENIAHLKANRYARERGAVGTHTLKEWNALKEKGNYKCAICGEEKKLTKDHIIPLSKGGNNFIENIQPVCRNCNSKKHNKLNYIHDNPELLEVQ
jgi:5-methylcytosine-specific restriction endonuclease McrA